MHSVSGQKNEDNKIWNQQCAIERVGVIETLKSFVQQMLAKIRTDAAGSGIHGDLR
jgi:hypothetical protein